MTYEEMLSRYDLEEIENIRSNEELDNRDLMVRQKTLNEVYGKYTNSSKVEFARWLNNERLKKRFKHWVTSEVLPSIRKHGIYATDNAIDNILNN